MMSEWISTINQKIKWMKWPCVIFCLLIGIYNIIDGFILLQDIQGDRSGMLFIISGSFFLLSGVFQFLPRYLTANIVGALSAVVGLIIFFIA